MAERKCLFIHGAAGAPTYSGADMRTLVAAAAGGRSFDSVVAGVGAIGRAHGVLTGDALDVTPAGTPDNTVVVTPGVAAVHGSQSAEQGCYLCPLEAAATLTIASRHLSLARTDYVVAQVRDNEYGVMEGDTWAVEIVQGTPGNGAPAVPADALVLASINVAAGSDPLVITSNEITDLRPHARPPGSIMPVSAAASLPAAMDYDVIWNTTLNELKVKVGDNWLTLGRDFDNEWAAYTPTLYGVSLGNGSRWGRYLAMDRTIILAAGFDLGTTGDVNGVIGFKLPFNARNIGSFRDVPVTAHAQIGAGHYAALGIIYPWYIPDRALNFSTRGGTSWTTTLPVNWASQGAPRGRMSIFTCYEKA